MNPPRMDRINMPEYEYADLPEILTRSEAIEVLAAMREEHRRIFDRAVGRAKDDLHPIDHVIAAALKRSQAFTQAFLSLVDQGNEFAAMPFIRMQLDNVLRISAFRLVSDSYALARFILEGNKLDKFDKKMNLSDFGLRTRLDPKYEYISQLYEETSGFVHLSQHHLIRAVEDWENPNRGEDALLSFGEVDDLPSWSEEHKKEALIFFCSATRFLLDEAEEVQAAERAE